MVSYGIDTITWGVPDRQFKLAFVSGNDPELGGESGEGIVLLDCLQQGLAINEFGEELSIQ